MIHGMCWLFLLACSLHLQLLWITAQPTLCISYKINKAFSLILSMNMSYTASCAGLFSFVVEPPPGTNVQTFLGKVQITGITFAWHLLWIYSHKPTTRFSANQPNTVAIQSGFFLSVYFFLSLLNPLPCPAFPLLIHLPPVLPSSLCPTLLQRVHFLCLSSCSSLQFSGKKTKGSKSLCRGLLLATSQTQTRPFVLHSTELQEASCFLTLTTKR